MSTPSFLRRYYPIGLKLLLIFLVAAAFLAFWYIATLPDRVDAQQTFVVGPTRLAPGSEAAVRVVVQEVKDGNPVSGAQIKVSLQPTAGGQTIPLFDGTTDDSGSLPLKFNVPADLAGDHQLIVETKSPFGRDRVAQPISIERDYRLLLTTDKPLYQPGQTIHMRALALSRFDLTSARDATIDFIVQDAKGNKVFRQSVPTSEFGVAAADFTLADMVNQGDYKLSVTLGDTTSEKTVEVRPYVLPKFGLQVSTDRTFYTPGQRVEGTIQADYFFGKPVAEGEVQILGVVYDVQRVEVADIRGQTDENGTYHFNFDLPDYFAASGLDSQQAQVGLEVTVIDQAEHPEQTSLVLPVAAQPIIIEAVAESGSLRPGVENIVYLLTAYPDGTPAQTSLQITLNGGPAQMSVTGEYGLAEFRFVPAQDSNTVMTVEATDETGYSDRREINFQTEFGVDTVLLRADRATYLVGETMNLTALTPVNFGDIYLDIVKEGQTLSTRSARVENGQATFAIDLSPDLYGTLELHAYKILLDGTIVRDSRVVVVDEPRDLDIAIKADKETYRPGEPATISFQTSDQVDKEPVQTALGLAIVDESVFALQRQDPGFAKLYFLLEAELMEPFYQIKGFELPSAYTPDQGPLRLAQDTSARAAWADAPTAGLGMQVNSRPEKIQALSRRQEQSFETLGVVVLLGLILVPFLLWLTVILALRGSGVVKQSLRGLVKVSLILVVVFAALYGLISFVSALSYEVGRLFWRLDPEESLLLVLGLIFGLSALGLAVYAWRRRDEGAKFIFLFSAAWIACLILLILASEEGTGPPEGLTIVGLLAFVLAPGAYLLYGQKLWAQGRRGPAWLATLMGGAATLPVLFIPFLLLSFGGGFGAAAPMRQAQFEMPMAAESFAGAEMAAVEEAVTEAEAAAPADDATGSAEAPRLRQFFPETLYWNPNLVTDEAGFAQAQLPMADSITTWRLTALASSQDGRLGFATQGIRVFQDFFVDIDLPVALTQGDEISIPIGVFNYLPQAQQVRLVVEPEPWFELLGQPEQTLTIASNDVEVVYFPIRVIDFGQRGFQVTAWGEQMSDAIRREVRVLPNGQEMRLSESNWLRENREIALNIPPEVVPRTPYVEVKIYTGVLAQVVEGLEKILRLPHG